MNVSAAGVEDEVVSQMMDCPPHLIGLLIGRGGSTIKRIKEESRANVVINQKMMKVCVKSTAHFSAHRHTHNIIGSKNEWCADVVKALDTFASFVQLWNSVARSVVATDLLQRK